MSDIIISLDGNNLSYNFKEDLWHFIARHTPKIEFNCSGNGRCGKCKVLAKNCGDISKEEEVILTAEEIDAGVRLACMLSPFDGMKIATIEKNDDIEIAQGSSDIKVLNPTFEKYGIAIDIGTTTVVVSLYDSDGEVAKASRKNPQAKYGSDVISRIEIHLKDKEILKKAIVNELNDMILEACKGTKLYNINSVVITGNTTMLYILTGRDVSSLATAPFEADHLFGEIASAKELGINLENAKIYLPKCICAFVGADISTAILASGMTDKNEISLLIDIGTNGEITLFKDGKITSAATAAGPAFEGGEISFGMAASSGAIDKVWFEDGQLKVTTIDDAKAIGICGSGLIDAIATLLEIEALDETGSLDEDVLQEKGILARVSDKTAVNLCDDVYLTGEDIRKIQLAKGAISAGAMTLISINNIDTNNVETVYIAGGFGSFLSIESALAIGLLPEIDIKKYKVIGNAALDGAAMLLCDKNKHELQNIKVNGYDLSTVPEFTNNFMECMMF